MGFLNIEGNDKVLTSFYVGMNKDVVIKEKVSNIPHSIQK